jgi:hypothetical protein
LENSKKQKQKKTKNKNKKMIALTNFRTPPKQQQQHQTTAPPAFITPLQFKRKNPTRRELREVKRKLFP